MAFAFTGARPAVRAALAAVSESIWGLDSCAQHPALEKGQRGNESEDE